MVAKVTSAIKHPSRPDTGPLTCIACCTVPLFPVVGVRAIRDLCQAV